MVSGNALSTKSPEQNPDLSLERGCILPVSGARLATSQPFRNAGTLSTGNLVRGMRRTDLRRLEPLVISWSSGKFVSSLNRW